MSTCESLVIIYKKMNSNNPKNVLQRQLELVDLLTRKRLERTRRETIQPMKMTSMDPSLDSLLALLNAEIVSVRFAKRRKVRNGIIVLRTFRIWISNQLLWSCVKIVVSDGDIVSSR